MTSFIPTLDWVQNVLREENIDPTDLAGSRQPEGSGLLVKVGDKEVSLVWHRMSYSDNYMSPNAAGVDFIKCSQDPVDMVANFELAVMSKGQMLPIGKYGDTVAGYVPWRKLRTIVRLVQKDLVKAIPVVLDQEVENV